jgi:hypothetical protein
MFNFDSVELGIGSELPDANISDYFCYTKITYQSKSTSKGIT